MGHEILPAPHFSMPSGQGQPPSAICVIVFDGRTRTPSAKKRQNIFIKTARKEPYRCTILVKITASAVVTSFFGT
jgi:hypothetical protein